VRTGCTPIVAKLLERHSHRVKGRRIITNREFILDVQVDGYDIKDVRLDPESNVNILPKKS